MKDETQTRRNFLRSSLTAAGGAVAVTLTASCGVQAAEALSTDDPTAKALQYTEDASKVDKAKAPTFKDGSNCGNCALYMKAQAANKHAPCGAFGNKMVAEQGWCLAWVQAPS
ncbi:MAG: high-potential iron-sulfur protein [Nevskiaceae bacterium]|jgi:hypothetical protein|nr:high-potential iron-sulfur protein [Nevskiaceae bacterium]